MDESIVELKAMRRMEGFNEGFREGFKEGYEEARQALIRQKKRSVCKLLGLGFSNDNIADTLEEPLATINLWLDERR